MSFIVKFARLCVAAAATGVSLLSILAFFGFASPVLDLINHAQLFLFFGTLISLLLAPALMGFGLFRRLLLAVTATAFLLSALIVVPETVAAFAPRPPPSDGSRVVRVVTHNLFGMNYDMARVAAEFRKADPDIIALQEYFSDQREQLHELLIPDYPYFLLCAGERRANNAIYSRLPFTVAPEGNCAETPGLGDRLKRILAHFTLPDGASFSVLTTHLDWPAPIWRQSDEMADLEGYIGGVPGPLVMVGDLNSTPWSYALRLFGQRAGLTRQTHNVLTYPLRYYVAEGWRDTPPFLALDHVLSRGLVVHDLRTLPPTGSDHLPVFFTFSVPPDAAAGLTPSS